MNNRELKDKITEGFISETPDVLDKIKKAAEKEEILPVFADAKSKKTKKRRFPIYRYALAAASLVLVFAIGFMLGGIGDKENTPIEIIPDVVASIYLDVNPSVEINVDENNKVSGCVALNEDAEKILEGLSLEGTEVKTALAAVIGTMYMNGYFNDESSTVLISVESEDGKADIILEEAVQSVEDIFEKSDVECLVVGQQVVKDERTEQIANESGVSIGKASLATKIMDYVTEYTGMTEVDVKELAEMSVKELGYIYSSLAEELDGKLPNIFGPGNGENIKPDDGNGEENNGSENGQGGSEEDNKENPGDNNNNENNGNNEEEKGEDTPSDEQNGYITKEDALKAVLSSLSIDEEDLYVKYVIFLYDKEDDGSYRMIYSVSFMLKNIYKAYSYKVDFKSGEIISGGAIDFLPGIGIGGKSE